MEILKKRLHERLYDAEKANIRYSLVQYCRKEELRGEDLTAN